jgi:hypothetical protein
VCAIFLERPTTHQTRDVHDTVQVPPNEQGSAIATCDNDERVTGRGYGAFQSSSVVFEARPYSGLNAFIVTANNVGGSTLFLDSTATCMKIVQ